MKNKEIKRRIKEILEYAERDPHAAIVNLRTLQRRKRSNTRIYEKIQRLIKGIEEEKRKTNYRLIFRQSGIDIPTQSAVNIQRLRCQTLEHFNDQVLVQRFYNIWYQEIVPNIVLKHVTRDIVAIKKSGYLLSIFDRSHAGDTVNKAHTRGGSARLTQIYFTLGLQDHKSPLYWSASEQPYLIEVAIGKAYVGEQKNLCPGLWISSHKSTQQMPSKYFGDTLRTVEYDNDEKITTYSYADGQKRIVRFHCNEEVFCAERTLKEVFDGLFYQVLEEIYYINGSFYADLFNQPNIILCAAFKHLYIPDIYPEAKISTGWFFIQQKFVTTSALVIPSPLDVQQLFEAIEKLDIRSINLLLQKNRRLVNAKMNDKTPLIATLDRFGWVSNQNQQTMRILANIIQLLLQNGADITLSAGFKTPLQCLIENRVFSQIPKILQAFLSGIPDLEFPQVRHCPSFHDMSIRALRKGNWFVFQVLKEHGIDVFANREVLLAAYQGQLPPDKIEELCDQANIDVHATNFNGETILMQAAGKNDVAFIIFLTTRFPSLNLNQQDYAGNTALHFATQKKAEDAVVKLLEMGADSTLVNNNGETAYSVSENGILELLESKQAACIPPPKLPEQACQRRTISAALLVQRGTKVLFVRKSSHGKPFGNFLFPGGLKDKEDMSLMATAVRECVEETGIPITATPQLLYEYRRWKNGVFCQLAIGYSELDSSWTQEPVANDDVAEALWIDWLDIEVTMTASGEQCYYYAGILIELSNAIIVNAVLHDCVAEQTETIKRILDLKFFGAEKLLDAYKQNNQEEFKQLISAGADPNSYPFIGLAVFDKQYVWIEFLCALGVDINCPFMQSTRSLPLKRLPLEYVISQGELQEADRLIRLRADVNLLADGQLSISGARSALISACALKENALNIHFIRQLLTTYKAKLSEDIGAQALCLALRQEKFQIAEALLQADTDGHIDLNKLYRFPGYLKQVSFVVEATILQSIRAVRFLLQHGAQPFVVAGENPLWHIDYNMHNFYICLLGMSKLEEETFNSFFSSCTLELLDKDVISLMYIRDLLLERYPEWLIIPNYEKEKTVQPKIIIQEIGGEKSILMVRDNKPGVMINGWHLPENNLPNLPESNLHDLYSFELFIGGHTPMVYTCNYQFIRLDNVFEFIDSLPSDYSARWFKLSELEDPENIVEGCDRLFCRKFLTDELHVQKGDPEIDKQVVMFKFFPDSYFGMAYRYDIQEMLPYMTKNGFNINATVDTRYHGPATLIFFDVQYNKSQNVGALQGLGADINAPIILETYPEGLLPVFNRI